MIRFFRQIVKRNIGAVNLVRLGYSSDTRLLIVHADDLGLSRSSNRATITAMEKGLINSASLMMPCPYASEAISCLKQNPENDIGIHLTLTSEWPGQKWKPVLGIQVPSLTNSEGYFFATRKELEKNANPSEVEQELRAQIELALANGIHPTHLDYHMFAAILNPTFLKVSLKLAKEFGLPALLNREKIKKWFGYDIDRFVSSVEVRLDSLNIASKRHARKGLDHYYRSLLRTLRPGLNCLLLHPAYDDEEMRLLTGGRANYNGAWRQADFDFFSSEECRNIIRENNIQLITWREIMKRAGNAGK